MIRGFNSDDCIKIGGEEIKRNVSENFFICVEINFIRFFFCFRFKYINFCFYGIFLHKKFWFGFQLFLSTIICFNWTIFSLWMLRNYTIYITIQQLLQWNVVKNSSFSPQRAQHDLICCLIQLYVEQREHPAW